VNVTTDGAGNASFTTTLLTPVTAGEFVTATATRANAGYTAFFETSEFGLNVVLSYMEGRAHGGPLVARSTVMAVLLNGITTIIGFGNLMVATHQGIFGLGLLLTIGTACGLATSLIVLPVILRLITRKAAVPAVETLRRTSAA